MKQGIDSILKVKVSNVNIDDVETAEFIARQGNVTAFWSYPSNTCVKVDNSTFGLKLSESTSYLFSAGQKVGLDAKIYLHGSHESLTVIPTEIEMIATLFKR